MKKILGCTLVLLCVMSLFSLGVYAATNGTCGDNVYWTLENSTLYIRGTGGMENYKNEFNVPWREYRDDITKVDISNGVTSIGDLAFCECINIESVKMPEGITRIGLHAFAQCENIKTISIPASVLNVDAYAFADTGIAEITLPVGIQSIGNAAFLGCKNLKFIKIPDTITQLPNYIFQDCKALENVNLPNTLKQIGVGSFNSCSSLKSINIPTSVNKIETSAFFQCGQLTNIKLPNNITTISQGAFMQCGRLEKISIPQGVTTIENGAFSFCTSLKMVSIPDTVTYMSSYAFSNCNLETIYYGGTFESWMKLKSNSNIGFENAKEYYNNYVPIIITVKLNGTMISFEQPPVIIDGRTLVPLRAIFESMGAIVDWDGNTQTVISTLNGTTVKLTIGSNILYKSGEAKTLDVPAQIINGYTMVPVRAIAEAFGADVNWDGDTQTVYITTKGNTYTVKTIPQITCDGYNANFADFNEMYIDSFTHSTNNNGSENVKFDVYNTAYIYGVVEIYDQNDNLTDVAIIDKMSNASSIKGVLIDNTGRLIKDLWNGTALTYRQESGYSKKTSINIDIPKNGYIKITNDMNDSLVASVINLSDIVFGAKKTFSTLNGFNSNTSKEYVSELSAKIIKEAAFAEMIKNPTKYTEKLWKGVVKELYMNPESVGGFLDTVSKNLDEFADGELSKLMLSTATDCGIGIAEGTFEALAGPAGVALKAMFAITSVTDILIEMNDGLDCLYQGSINISAN